MLAQLRLLQVFQFSFGAKQNNRKAKLALKGETVSFGKKTLSNSYYTALSFTIRF